MPGSASGADTSTQAMPFIPPSLSKSAVTSTSISPMKKSTAGKTAQSAANAPKAGGHHGRHQGVVPEADRPQPIQNAASRNILQDYYKHELPNVPVDPRNGLDMRTLCAAQNPSYLSFKQGRTYETTPMARRPYYEGGISDQLREGTGKCVFGNTYYSYEGQWSKGKMHGPGKFMMQDGGFFEGDFVKGEITGSGMRQWADGSQYTGQFMDGEMHGAGHLIRADGERYEGGWKRNQRSGQGVLVAPDGSRYEGSWEEHRLNGHGTLEGADGQLYDGEWFNGNMDGVGDLREACGDHYTGRFMAGRKNGPGTFFHAASGMSYRECDWLNDFPRIMPAALQAERKERIEWVPKEKPEKPKGEDEGEGDGAAAAGEEEEEKEEEVPPPSLVDVLKEPIAPGGAFPEFVVRVVDLEGNHQDCEHGRLIEMCAGVFEEVAVEKAEGEEGGGEQEEPAEDGEEAKPPPPPTYKIYPTPPMTLKIVAPPAAPAEGEEAQEPPEEAQQEQVGEEAQEPAEGGESEGGGGPKDKEYDFGRKYPPRFILDGLKISRGMLGIVGLTIPEDVEAGEYRLKISSTYQSPFCDVEPLYINFTVG